MLFVFNVWYNSSVKPSGSGLFFLGKFFIQIITDSLPLFIIELSRLAMIKKSTNKKVGEMWRKENPHTVFVGM